MDPRSFGITLCFLLLLGLVGCGVSPLGTGLLSGNLPEGWTEGSNSKDFILRIHDESTPKSLWIEILTTAAKKEDADLGETWVMAREETRKAQPGAVDPDPGASPRTVRIYRRKLKTHTQSGKIVQKVGEAAVDTEIDKDFAEGFLGELVLTEG